MDDDCLPGAPYINLCRAGDVQVPQISLQLLVGCFQVEESLHEGGRSSMKSQSIQHTP